MQYIFVENRSMNPELFKFEVPSFLRNLFSSEIIIFSYPTFIFIGAIIAYYYFKKQNKEFVSTSSPFTFLIIIILSAYIGGKLFFILEDPSRLYSIDKIKYIFLSKGFVFYGSFLFSIISVTVVLHIKNMSVLKNLDVIAVSTAIVQFFGRLGCFFAGCCYGKPTDNITGVIFPKNQVKVHPTQLYEAFMLLIIIFILLYVKKNTKTKGKLILIYLSLYAFGRFFLEFFRGDTRGYFFKGMLSHSQLIAIFILATVLIVLTLRRKLTKI